MIPNQSRASNGAVESEMICIWDDDNLVESLRRGQRFSHKGTKKVKN